MDTVGLRYTINQKLGQGGMGAIFQATDRLSGDTLALKRLNSAPRGFGDNQAQRMFLTQEFRILASLRHPNVITVQDYGFDDDGHPFFTMELLHDARDIVRESITLSLIEKIQLLIQLLQALAYLHRRGILHRDLKPNNILVQRGVVKVLDFGLAIEALHRDAEPAGTPRYMAPELIRGRAATVSSDLYAVGVIAFQMITGEHPFNVGNVGEMARLVLESQPDFSKLLHVSNTLTPTQPPRAFAGETDDDHTRTPSDLKPLDDDPTLPPAERDPTVGIETIIIDPTAHSDDPKRTTRQFKQDTLPGIIETLLDKDPNARYTDAESVIRALCRAAGLPLPVETQEIRDSYLKTAPFVGRDNEMSQLVAALQAVKPDARGSAWLVGGESGSGKSRLVDELRVQALVDGLLVLHVQADDNAPTALHPWRNALQRLALIVNIDAAEAAILQAIVPDIDRFVTAVADHELDDINEHQAAEARIIDTMLSVFHRINKPTVLLIEDVQWTPLDILRRLTVQTADVPLMVVATFRSDLHADLPTQLPATQHLALRRLHAPALQTLAESIIGQAGADPAILELLQRESEGNVLFVIEVLRSLAAASGGLDNIVATRLPERVTAGGIESVIQARLDRLPPWTLQLLRAAALFGRRLDEQLLYDLANFEHGETLADWLLACSAAALIEPDDSYWRFSHDRIREAITTSFSAEQRQRLHHAIVIALEKRHDADPQTVILLAEHCGGAGDVEREAMYVGDAADIAWQRGNSKLAARYYRRALDVLRVSDAERTKLRIFLAHALRETGQSDEALLMYEQALDASKDRENHEDHGRILNGLARVAMLQGRYDEGRGYCNAALDLAVQHDLLDLRAYALDNLANIEIDTGNFLDAIEHGKMAIEIYQQHGNERGAARSTNTVGIAHAILGRLDEAGEFFAQALEINRRIGNRRGIGAGLSYLGNINQTQQRHHAAINYYIEGMAIAREIGDGRGKAVCIGGAGTSYMHLGNFTRAQKYYQGALEQHAVADDRPGVVVYQHSLGKLLRLTGAFDASHRELNEALAAAEKMDYQEAVVHGQSELAWLYYVTGDNENALLHAKMAVELAQQRRIVATVRDSLFLQGMIALEQGNVDAAYALVDEIHASDRLKILANLLSGIVALHMGEETTAKTAFETLERTINTTLEQSPGLFEITYLLIIAAAGRFLLGDTSATTVAAAVRNAVRIVQTPGINRLTLRHLTIMGATGERLPEVWRLLQR